MWGGDGFSHVEGWAKVFILGTLPKGWDASWTWW